jgi:4-amino-4-deoxy-L-arabinose transferase-like glycosyltransferase
VSTRAEPDPIARPTVLACAAAFLAVAVVHVFVWWQYRSDPFASTYVSDALSYHQWASRLAEQGLRTEPVFHQSPLFPVLLGAVYALAPEAGRAAASIGVQALLLSAAVACLVPLGRLWFGQLPAGVAAAALALLHGPFVFYAMKLLPVPLALATQAAGLLALAWVLRRRRATLALVAGATWGLACLARSEMLCFVPFAVAAVAHRRPTANESSGRRLMLAGAYLVGLLLAVAPVAVHNLRQGDFVVVASAGGENLFVGNQRGAEGGHTPLHDQAVHIFAQRMLAQRVAEEEEGRSLRPSEVSAYWRTRAFDEIAADPAGWLVLEAKKLRRLLHPGDPTDIYSYALERDRYLPALHVLAVTPWTLLLLGGVGEGLALRRTAHGAWPLVALAGVHVVVLLVFFVDTRLRLPLLFALCPLAGHAVAEAVRRWRSGTDRRPIAGVACLVLLALLVGFVATRPTARDAVRLASVLSMQQRLDESLEVTDPYVRGPGADPLALDQSGWVLQKRGEFAAARDRYLAALEGDLPAGRARQTRTRLAQVYERLGQFDEAAAQHDAAVASDRASAATYYERGMFRLRRKQIRGAVEDLRRATLLDPAWEAPRATLRAIGAE